MKLTCRLFYLIVLLFAITTQAGRAADFFFHDGDQPGVFLGDSITQQKMYTTLIEAYVLSRYPTWHSTFRNLGWSGDRAGVGRVDRDVLPLHPAAITIDFGMNDARAGEAGYDQFVTNSLKLVQQLKANGMRVALLTPSPEERYESGQPAGSSYNQMLWKYSQALHKIADQEHILFIDQYTPFVQAVEAGRKAGVLSATNSDARLIPDGVHPNWAGHLVMATAILKGLGASAVVSRAELDAKAVKWWPPTAVTLNFCRLPAAPLRFAEWTSVCRGLSRSKRGLSYGSPASRRWMI